jgi:NAD/NADP transhydrogenase alpha subunit
MDTNIEISPQDLLQAVATLSGQQFVAAAMAEAGRLKAMRELAALQAPPAERLRDVSADA